MAGCVYTRRMAKVKAADSVVGLKIRVTREHIKKGTYSNMRCPIGLAVRAHLPRRWEVRVGYQVFASLRVRKHKGADFVYYRIPDVCVKFMRAFDIGARVKPFSFIIGRSYVDSLLGLTS